MKDRELKKYLQQSLQQEVKQSVRLEEAVKLCTEIMQEQGFAQKSQEEPRTGFM